MGLRAFWFLLKSLYLFQDFDHGTTEIMHLASLASRLKELFAALQESKSSPVILLVHDQEVTRSVLQCAGVDTSHCNFGIRDLLGHPPEVSAPRLQYFIHSLVILIVYRIIRLATDVDRVPDRLTGTHKLTRSTCHRPEETISITHDLTTLILGVVKTRVAANV
jgi:hypothetical protein